MEGENVVESLIQNDWHEVLKGEFEKPYYINLKQFLSEEYQHHVVYPAQDNIYQALKLTSYHNTRVVILGQDPYHGPRQAHGLSFSVPRGVKQPPSLQNILKELQQDQNIPLSQHGCLESWAHQGVLLLNTVLTVRAGEPNSHAGRGWEQITDQIILKLNQKEEPVAFLLWGKPAQQKQALITNPKHLILTSVHPSPLSAYRGFFGSSPFSKINNWLAEQGKKPIDWTLQ